MYRFKIRDADSYRQRLQRLLSDRCLLFNPYDVPDSELMEVSHRQKWRGAFSLTQMVILRFTRIEHNDAKFRKKERIFYTVGDSGEEIGESMDSFTYPQTAADSLRPVRHTINGRKITQAIHMQRLIGKSVFVSRNIITCRNSGFGKAMSMHRLTGNTAKDAEILREAMIDARLEMLERLLKYPQSQFYLDGTPSAPVDYRTPICALINRTLSMRLTHRNQSISAMPNTRNTNP